jgi:hypothetical protein
MKPKKYEYIIFAILMTLFVTCANCQDVDSCEYKINTYDLIKLDSMFRGEQLRLMQIQKARAYGVDVELEFECTRRKLKAIEERIISSKNLTRC